MGRSILIVEDEKEIRDLLAHYLRREGFSPTVAPDGETGWEKARTEKPELILLDILLPGMDGLELLRKIRTAPATSRIPVVMLTAKGDETDRIVGLELGADDYIPKPFSPREVVARIKAVIRRAVPAPGEAEKEEYVYGDLRMDVPRHEVLLRGKPVPLTPKEFRILQTCSPPPGAFSPGRRSWRGSGEKEPTSPTARWMSTSRRSARRSRFWPTPSGR
jgi:DNA-binding response OmpR family regulator